MPDIRIAKLPKGFVQNNGTICGECGLSFATTESLVKHWAGNTCLKNWKKSQPLEHMFKRDWKGVKKDALHEASKNAAGGSGD